MPKGWQTYAKPRLSDREGRAQWHSMYREVRNQRLTEPSLVAAHLRRVARTS